MAKYTIELRKVCDLYGREEVESWFKNYDIYEYLTYNEVQTIINTGIWNKDRLARKIVDHYFMREKGKLPFNTRQSLIKNKRGKKHFLKKPGYHLHNIFTLAAYNHTFDERIRRDFRDYFTNLPSTCQ